MTQQYPLVMAHPNFVPAVVQNEAEGVEGKASVFPPMIVNDPDQEAQARATGYFAMGEVSADYTYSEYPKWVDAHTVIKTAAEEKAWKKKQVKPEVAPEPEASE